MTQRCTPYGIFAASFLVLGSSALWAENWPQWRGPEGDCVSKEKNLPTEWNETKNIAWKLKMPGMGSSTPAVWGDHIFVTAEDGKELFALCISTKGQELWRKNLGPSDGKHGRDESNEASPSPCTDGKYVYFLFGTGDLGCFDFDGKEIWVINVQDRYGKMIFQHGGIHATPILHGDHLYLQLLNRLGSNVVALDKTTGKEVWKITRASDGRGEGKEVYASPTIGHSGKNAYLIVHGNDYATGHSLKDGSELWRVGDLNSKVALQQPVSLRHVAHRDRRPNRRPLVQRRADCRRQAGCLRPRDNRQQRRTVALQSDS